MRIPDSARLLHRHLRGQWKAVRRLAAWSALEAAPLLASGFLLARAIDDGFLAGKPLTGMAWLGLLAALHLAGALATNRLYPWLAATVEPLRDSLVTEVVSALLAGMPAEDAGTAGAGVSQLTEQTEAVRALLATAMRSLRQLLTAGVAALTGLVLLAPALSVVIVPFVVLAVMVFAGFLGVQARRFRLVIHGAERVGQTAAPIAQGVRDVVACGAEERAAATVGEAIDRQAAALRGFARSQLLRLPVLTLGVHIPLVGLLALAPGLVADRHLTLGQVAGAVNYLVTGLQPAITILVDAGGTLVLSLAVVLGRLAEVTAAAPGEVTAAAPGDVDVPSVVPRTYGLKARGLTFAYSHHAQPVISDVDLTLPEGSHLAVVGPSGVGKSTLANLLTGLAAPGRGEITLGGVPLDRIGRASLSRLVTLIPQEAYVFAGSLRDNLAYLNPEATPGEIEKAAGAVGLAETVTRLGGYDAEIPPGGGMLSQGERQLITLTRAYLSTAPVLILDEATCHLDPVAEARAERALADRGGTLVVVAHRISSARRADRILVMNGHTAVVGTHDELLERSPLYAELVGHW